MDLFIKEKPPKQPLKSVCDTIRLKVQQSSNNLLASYLTIQEIVQANPYYTPEEIATALGADDAQELQRQAILCKTHINASKPGTIADTVPEAQITMP